MADPISSMLNRKHSCGKLYVDPQSAAAQCLAASEKKPACLQRVAFTPQAIWVTDVSAIAGLRTSLESALANKEIVVVVLYTIPGRDFGGGYSAGGEETEDSYRAYVDALCDVIAQHRVISIVEPDAIPDMLSDEFGQARAKSRTTLLKYACERLGKLSQTDVYLECGHSDWPDEKRLNQWLQNSGILDAITGIAMNVSNYKSAKECLGRARTLLDLAPCELAPLVIDCSRNGASLDPDLSSADSWCNPPGARLGPEPALSPANYHAQLWIKRPGESDGEHNSGVPAGRFSLDLCCRLCGE